MIDTHCHLNYEPLDAQLNGVLERATVAGVTDIVVPGTSLESSRSAVALAAKHPQVHACVGVHPLDAEYGDGIEAELIALLEANSNIVAVGEVGLDFYRTELGIEMQEGPFRRQIAVAKRFNKPLIIHSRDAFTDLHRILAEEMPHPSVIHCFTGTAEEAAAWLEIGCMLSVTGIITYKNAAALREVVRDIPLERLMIETDAPYLAPQSKRGQTCEPAYVAEVRDCLAEIKGISAEEVDVVTTTNARSFFNLK